MSGALVTLNLGKRPEWSRSYPLFRAYAAKHDLEFVVIDTPRYRYRPRWFRPRLGWFLEKLQLAELLKQFSPILYLDGDVCIHPDAPGPAEIQTDDAFCCVREDVGPLSWKRDEEMETAEKHYGKLPDNGPVDGYFNAGMMLASRAHAGIFQMPEQGPLKCRWPDQTLFNYQRRRLAINTHWLPEKYNLVPEFGEVFNNPGKRRDAHFIHYAGKEGKPFWEEDLAFFYKAWNLGPVDR